MSQVGSNSGWSQNVVLTVLAWDSVAEGSLPTNVTVAGLAQVQLANNDDVEVFTVDIASQCELGSLHIIYFLSMNSRVAQGSLTTSILLCSRLLLHPTATQPMLSLWCPTVLWCVCVACVGWGVYEFFVVVEKCMNCLK